mmetsp:Transcript_34084/g.101691  ORF Transcript_34084/g.101691 Transcript_34084/m.101691 type:complete len:291 (-) Transcript_34084:462-1334(-)
MGGFPGAAGRPERRRRPRRRRSRAQCSGQRLREEPAVVFGSERPPRARRALHGARRGGLQLGTERVREGPAVVQGAAAVPTHAIRRPASGRRGLRGRGRSLRGWAAVGAGPGPVRGNARRGHPAEPGCSQHRPGRPRGRARLGAVPAAPGAGPDPGGGPRRRRLQRRSRRLRARPALGLGRAPTVADAALQPQARRHHLRRGCPFRAGLRPAGAPPVAARRLLEGSRRGCRRPPGSQPRRSDRAVGGTRTRAPGLSWPPSRHQLRLRRPARGRPRLQGPRGPARCPQWRR